MPLYDLNIAIFDTIRYIVPSLAKTNLNRKSKLGPIRTRLRLTLGSVLARVVNFPEISYFRKFSGNFRKHYLKPGSYNVYNFR